MADIKWIKVTTDIFDNRKIKRLRKLENGDTIALLWFFLLSTAGRCNDGGLVYFDKDIPYTVSDLADDFGSDEAIIQKALEAMERLNMIDMIDGGFIHISGWAEHQNVESMDKIREQNRQRQQRFREKHKQPERKPKAPEPQTEERKVYGEYKNVLLTDSDLEKLKAEFPEDWRERIERLSEYMASTGKSDKYKNHFATIKAWAKEDAEKKKTEKNGENEHSYDLDEVRKLKNRI